MMPPTPSSIVRGALGPPMSVATQPGHTALMSTSTPLGTSDATVTVSALSAALLTP